MINNNWDMILKDEYSKDYFQKLKKFVEKEYKNKVCHPKYSEIFNALKFTDYEQVKVVIIGQDPYHGDNEAHGLSFSVRNGTPIPPSLRNIFKELKDDLGIVRNTSDLSGWAHQGVLLLNSIMSVEKDKPLSHKNKGWEIFTDEIISKLNERKKPIVFILWGSYAKSKKTLITNHKIIESVHPSPLSAYNGFFGSKPFSKCNEILIKNNIKPISWEM